MAAIGSWIRFFIGILLSLEVLRVWSFGGSISIFGNLLAAAFLILSAVYFVARF